MKNRNANWLQEKGGWPGPGKSNELETGRQNLKDLFKIFGGTPSRKKCGMWLTEIAAFAQIRAFVKQVQVFWVISLNGMTGRLEEPPVWKISSHSMVQRQPTWDQTRCCFGKSSAQSSKLTTHLEQLRKKPGAKIRHCYVVGFRSKARVVFLSFFFGEANRLGFVFSKNRVWADRVSPVQTGFLGFGSEREKKLLFSAPWLRHEWPERKPPNVEISSCMSSDS